MIRDALLHAETRVERRKRTTRARIFRAALDLFVAKGLEETTVAEIAERADIGKGTFFTYFPTKESVFAQVTADLVTAMERRLDRANGTGADIEARVLAFFRPAVDWHAANPVLSRHMVTALMRDFTHAQADRLTLDRMYGRLARELAAAQAAGVITADVEVSAACTAIGGTYFGTLGAWHGSGRSTSLADDFARSLHIVFRGLRP